MLWLQNKIVAKRKNVRKMLKIDDNKTPAADVVFVHQIMDRLKGSVSRNSNVPCCNSGDITEEPLIRAAM